MEQSPLAMAALVIASSSIIALWLLIKIRATTKPSSSLPPGPRGLPIVGYLPFLTTHLHKCFTQLAETYGPIYKLWLGHKMYVVIGSSSLAKQIRDQDLTFADRDPPIAAKITTHGGNDIAFSSYGPDWKKLRKVFVRELLSNSRLDASFVLRKQQVERAVKDVYMKRGTPLDFGQLVFMTVSNIVLRMLWGGSIRGEEGEAFHSRIRELTDEVMVLLAAPNISDLIPALARFDLQGIARKSRKVHQGFDQILSSLIEKRRKVVSDLGGELEDTKEFLQILLDLNTIGTGDASSSITDNQLKGIIHDVILGGTDTTATTIEWTMAMLMQNPDVKRKVYEELDEVIGRINPAVEETHLPVLRYLDATIKETFRLHPTLPLLVPRCPSQDCKIGGYTIPKGATVMINAYAIHRDPQLWTDPLEFRPERFLDEEGSKLDYLGNSCQYFPFGTGRRVCAGIPMAEKMLKYVLASLLHSFEWNLGDGAELDLSDKFGIVVKLEKSLLVVPTPRLPSHEMY